MPLVEMAIGDAYGAGFEFITPIQAQVHGLENDGVTYYPHPELEIGNGRYTDDTQMAIAVAEALLAGGEFAPHEFAPRVFNTFKRDPRKGYGSRFYDLLCEVQNGEELLERLDNNSTRSGGAMRVGPIGLYADEQMVTRMAILQAVLTHNTGEAFAAAIAVAQAVHYLAYRKGPRADVLAYVASKFHDPHVEWHKPYDGGWVTVQGLPCAHAAITAVSQATSLTDLLKRSVAFGGDVDTIAAMAMFAGSLAEDLPNDLDPKLYSGLENGTYGRNWLAMRDVELIEFARKQGAPL